MSNTFGKYFSVTTFGESHGPYIGVVIDGCPAGLKIDEAFIQDELLLRKPGQSKITTQRKESDHFEIISGVFNQTSTGTPITILIKNEDHRSNDYDFNKDSFRPGHADFTYQSKYGIRDYRGGGRSSARETATRVAAGAIAKLILKQKGIEIFAHVYAVGKIFNQQLPNLSIEELKTLREQNVIRCVDQEIANQMIQNIDEVRKNGDSIGGRINCIIRGCPPGIGEPVFDKLQAELAKAMLSINAVHGFEYGSGFEGTTKLGSENNDPILEGTNLKEGIISDTNHTGGILGGISTGQPIYFNVGFKPVSTILKEQETVDLNENPTTIKGKGRHDPCVVPRAVVIVEAMTALVLVNLIFKNSNSKI
ncbi:chorismate synthase [Pedobacter flavus]|uniref:Chorismate synthase n=1 Tax=Pedobacter flavus TaxID=3113906 RepID=A0ABU7H294_9SPHI|nr:chorismate synthase [Pedobacter sp. VNH31]MEE1885431.1 chorismate synthase [Pedobacter sp. VNH31]